jgi:Cu(I)/Ag(I) efflux system membrane fusion protein
MKPAQTSALVALAVALLAGGFYLGRATGHGASATTPASPAASSPDGRKVLYWHDPMVPGHRFDKPGKSPFMDMDLVPVYEDSDSGSGSVSVSPHVQQNLGIRVAAVRRAEVASSFDAIGSVQFDERLNVAVQTRVAGYVEQLSVRAPMERVRKGQALAVVFAPEWLGPQNELLALKKSGASRELVDAARERMRALSIPASLIRQSEESGMAQARFVVTAPASGVVAELGVREGQAVSPGMTLFRIAGLDQVWAVAEVPEAQAVRLTRGQKVKAVLQADPGQAFEGQLKEILPEVASTTRTLKARFEVDNKAGKLTPGMLLQLEVAGPKSTRLVVPSEAVIRTGERALVIVRKDDGRFEQRDVTLGQELREEVEIVSGLEEGEQIVASGQFLIDSEARLRSVLGVPGVSAPASAPAAASAPTTSAAGVHVAEGKVESVGPDRLTISHGPVPSLKWPAMTMDFGKPAANAFADVKPGDSIHFQFKEGGPSGYQLLSVQRLHQGAKP